MKHIRMFGKFWYDFIIGDDWRVALGITTAITLLYFVDRQGRNWWWALPLVVTGLLAVSLNNATHVRRR